MHFGGLALNSFGGEAMCESGVLRIVVKHKDQCFSKVKGFMGPHYFFEMIDANIVLEVDVEGLDPLVKLLFNSKFN